MVAGSLTPTSIMTTAFKSPPMSPPPPSSPQPSPSPLPRASKAAWLVPVGLITLTIIPVLGGIVRLIILSSGAAVTPANARFAASPLPFLIHMLGATLFCILGAFQFVPSLRRPRSGWHRAVGRVLIPCGLAAASSGLWMTLFYPWPVNDGVILYGLRLLFGSAMLVSILLSVAAIWRRDFARHGDWMLRGYAIGMGAGTQALVLMVGEIIVGPPSMLLRAVLMGAAWVINLAVAEWIIRRRSTRPTRTAAAVVASLS